MIGFLIRISLIVAISAGTSWLAFSKLPFYWPLISGITLFILVAEFYRFQKRLERSVWLFFRSVKNSDQGFRFDESRKGNKLIRNSYTEMNRINEQVRELKLNLVTREQYYQTLLDKVSTGIFTLESSGFTEYVNPSVLHCLDLPILSHIRQLAVPHPKLYQHLKAHEAKDKIIYQAEGSGSKTELSVITQKISVRNKELLVVILQNIREEMEQKELDAWIRLIRVQAHEIRNSLAPISSIAESLLDRVIDKEIQANIEIILERSRHLKSFVESYDELTHLPRPEISDFKADDLVSRLRILVSYAFEQAGVKFSIQLADPVGDIRADYNQLTQVLLNLVRNAIQAVQNEENPEIDLSISQNEKDTLIALTDNGHGIPAGLEEEIFIPFFTTRSAGTGIGLSLSRQIIRMHRGEIRASNVHPKGARFTLTLPL